MRISVATGNARRAGTDRRLRAIMGYFALYLIMCFLYAALCPPSWAGVSHGGEVREARTRSSSTRP